MGRQRVISGGLSGGFSQKLGDVVGLQAGSEAYRLALLSLRQSLGADGRYSTISDSTLDQIILIDNPTYQDYLFRLIASQEQIEIFSSTVPSSRFALDFDGGGTNGNPVIGFGFDLFQNRVGLYDSIVAAGIQLPNDAQLISDLRKLTENTSFAAVKDIALRLRSSGFSISYDEAKQLYVDITIDAIEKKANNFLGYTLPQSIERAFVVDLAFQGNLLQTSNGQQNIAGVNYSTDSRVKVWDSLRAGRFEEAVIRLAFGTGATTITRYEERHYSRAFAFLGGMFAFFPGEGSSSQYSRQLQVIRSISQALIDNATDIDLQFNNGNVAQRQITVTRAYLPVYPWLTPFASVSAPSSNRSARPLRS